MTLEQLRIFVAVAERAHLTQAAAVLALTPSAVSSAIRMLEKRYETPLFDRIGRGIVLTEAGRVFLDQARATLASARAAEQSLIELNGLQRGRLHIFASQTVASYWLPAPLVRYRLRYPAVEVVLEVGNTWRVAQAVSAGEADLGLVEGAVDGDQLAIAQVGTDRILLVVPPEHPWAAGRPLSAAKLLTSRWISREAGSGTRSVFESTLRHSGVDPGLLDIALTLPTNEAVRGAVEASGNMAAALSEWVATPALEAGRLKRVKFALAPRDFSLLTHRARHRTRAAQALIDMLIGTSQ